MAVYRCEIKTIGRAAGRSSVAAAAYRSAGCITNDRDGVRHDYRRRGPGVVHTELVTPSAAPEWAQQRGRLWNEAEAAENRRNSVTAREVIVSLPHELDDAQRADLVRGFAAGLVDRYGVVVDMSLHRPDPKGDNRNHHAHLMMTTRRLTAEGFTEKTRELDDQTKPKDGGRPRGPLEVEAIRALWEQEQNNALSRAGVAERVTRKSLAEQGIDREPQPKIGEAANALMRRGEPARRGELHKEVADRNAMKENAAHVAKLREQEDEQRRVTMREHMARQRTERLEAEKREAVARALDAAAQQAARDQAEKQRADKERAERQASQPEAPRFPGGPQQPAAAFKPQASVQAPAQAQPAQAQPAKPEAHRQPEAAPQLTPPQQPDAAPSLPAPLQPGKPEPDKSEPARQQPPPPDSQREAKAPPDPSATRAWERQRQEEYRRQREAEREANRHSQDLGRTRKRDPV